MSPQRVLQLHVEGTDRETLCDSENTEDTFEDATQPTAVTS